MKHFELLMITKSDLNPLLTPQIPFTLEIAAFGEFSKLLGDPEATAL